MFCPRRCTGIDQQADGGCLQRNRPQACADERNVQRSRWCDGSAVVASRTRVCPQGDPFAPPPPGTHLHPTPPGDGQPSLAQPGTISSSVSSPPRPAVACAYSLLLTYHGALFSTPSNPPHGTPMSSVCFPSPAHGRLSPMHIRSRLWPYSDRTQWAGQLMIGSAALTTCCARHVHACLELQSLLGEGASVVLDGQRVLPSRAQASGFSFQYNDVGAALQSIMRQ